METRSGVDVLPPAGAEVVHDDRLVPPLEAAIHHVGADEARAARHQDLHADALWGDGARRAMHKEGRKGERP